MANTSDNRASEDEFNTIAGGYIFFLDLAIFSTLVYVDKYLLTSLALFFLSANFGRRKSPDHGARRKWPLAPPMPQ